LLGQGLRKPWWISGWDLQRTRCLMSSRSDCALTSSLPFSLRRLQGAGKLSPRRGVRDGRIVRKTTECLPKWVHFKTGMISLSSCASLETRCCFQILFGNELWLHGRTCLSTVSRGETLTWSTGLFLTAVCVCVSFFDCRFESKGVTSSDAKLVVDALSKYEVCVLCEI